MIRSDDSGTTITGPDIEVYKVLTIRRGLILKIDTGMDLTRISCLSVARRDGITTARTGRAALKDVNTWLEQRGAGPRWSKKYPNG
jgi:hypothetical protein